jgi:serine/threonine-protein kinase
MTVTGDPSMTHRCSSRAIVLSCYPSRCESQAFRHRLLTTVRREPNEVSHSWPEFLPGQQAVLFTIVPTGSVDDAQVAVLDLTSGAQTILVRGGMQAHYVSTGHLVYATGGALHAAPFELQRRQITGSSVPVVEKVMTTLYGAANFDVAGDGTLVYLPGGAAGVGWKLVWLDRQGHEEPTSAPMRAYAYPRLSPDGTRVAFDMRDQERDISIWDFKREVLTRLTFGTAAEMYPVWTKDGRRVIFSSDRGGAAQNLFWQPADGTGAPERLTQSTKSQFATSVSCDDSLVILREDDPTPHVVSLSLDGERRVTPLIHTSPREENGELSPDCKWLAYQSNESGQDEIYVRPFPDVERGKWQVSVDGGTRPLWARNGEELFYLAPGVALMSATIENHDPFRAAKPVKLFEGRYGPDAPRGRTYDVSPDGKRFLMIKLVDASGQSSGSASLVLVQHFDEELKRLVPTK